MRGARRLLVLAACSGCLAVPGSAGAIEPLAEIGTPGTGAGQLAAPQGLTVDGAGTIYVSEAGSNRVSRFDLNGNFIDAFGADVIPGGPTGFEVCSTATACKAGVSANGAGELATPIGVATTASGDRLAIAGPPANRISEYSGTGAPAFIHGFGYDTIPGPFTGFEICTAATTCQAGASGFSLGQLSNPLSSNYLPTGNLLALSAIGQFQEYASDRQPVRSFGFPGSGAGNLSAPFDFTLGPAGELVVIDSSNNRVSVFGPNGNFLRAFGFNVIPGAPVGYEVCTIATSCGLGTAGSGAGALSSAFGIAVGPGGEVYVTDGANNRVSQFTLDGQFVGAFGYDVIPGGSAGFETCTAATTCQAGTNGAAVGELSQPVGIATDCRGTLYVAEGAAGEVTKFGEPGARKPPCPSNAFTIGTAKLNKKKGTATLPVSVPGPGALTLAGKNLKPASLAPTLASDLTLKIKPNGKLKKKLKKKGKAKAKPQVTFTPTNGDPNAQGATIGLKRKAKKR
jgi:DNA-binding beta-propeller fold protein YncE